MPRIASFSSKALAGLGVSLPRFEDFAITGLTDAFYSCSDSGLILLTMENGSQAQQILEALYARGATAGKISRPLTLTLTRQFGGELVIFYNGFWDTGYVASTGATQLKIGSWEAAEYSNITDFHTYFQMAFPQIFNEQITAVAVNYLDDPRDAGLLNGDFSNGLTDWETWVFGTQVVTDGVLTLGPSISNSILEQIIPTVIGEYYQISFDVVDLPSTPAGNNLVFRVETEGNLGDIINETLTSTASGTRIQHTFKATQSLTTFVWYNNPDFSRTEDIASIDNIRLEYWGVKTYYIQSSTQQIDISTLGWSAVPGDSEALAVELTTESLQALIDLGTPVGTDLTIEIKLKVSADTGGFIGLAGNASNQGYGFQQSGGFFTGGIWYNGSTSSPGGSIVSIYNSDWTTVAIVRQGTTYSYYSTLTTPGTLTRHQSATLPVGAQAAGYEQLWIGRSTYPDASAVGGIFESIRISNTARYTTATATEPAMLTLDANTVELVVVTAD